MGRRGIKWRLKMVAKPIAGNLGGPYYVTFILANSINWAYQVMEIKIHENPLFDFFVEEYR